MYLLEGLKCLHLCSFACLTDRTSAIWVPYTNTAITMRHTINFNLKHILDEKVYSPRHVPHCDLDLRIYSL